MSPSLSSPTRVTAEALPAAAGAGLRKRLAKDRLVTQTVGVSGFSVIFVILAIFFVIAAEVAPLFESPEISLIEVRETGASGRIFALGTEEYKTVAYTADERGLRFYSLIDNTPYAPVTLPDLEGATPTGATHPQQNMVVLGLSDGRALPVQIHFDITFPDGKRRVSPRGEPLDFIRLNDNAQPVELLAHFAGEDGLLVAGVTGANEVTAVSVIRKKTLMGTYRTRQERQRFLLPNKGAISALAVGQEMNSVFAGTASGQIIRLGLAGGGEDASVDVIGATPDGAVKITLMQFLKGGMTLILGDQDGRVYSSQIVREQDRRYRLDIVHPFRSHPRPVTLMDYSGRDKGFLTGDASGLVQYHYGTSGKTEYQLATQLSGGLRGVVLAPKGDGILAINGQGRLKHWKVHNPHPGITLKTLFGKVRYEGYEDENYAWQSTGGTDDFEPKLSLTPLIFGTLKGTLYAMLFAAPLALLAACYASQFMHRSLMALVKPTVEFMAALPSVVLGFFAALWLAPRVEELLPAIVMLPVVVIALIVGLQYLCEHTQLRIFFKRNPAVEFYFLLGVVVVAAGLSVLAGGVVEETLLKGDFRVWLLDVSGLAYDQRNSLVVGMAMGFAVIPIIFTIAEDSLSSVPKLLSAGSLALGATPWQTALRVVLPTASPGIFSALMIGFGRAVGETMIVLMATGNTPVMNWSAFSGFRALSANIAVELPEAPEGGTLFRVLFLAALLLFVFTFAVNSLAEWIRLKLRKKYRVL